jgi:5-amino-6-(5-phosphoribosylamino)uracil reductase
VRFDEFAERKTREVERARLHRLETVDSGPAADRLSTVGNEWTRHWYDDGFHLFEPPADRPAISVVFVQSREGNTTARNPDELGGGPTDKHLIYEGLTRAAADAVLAGAATAAGASVFFSVWHPEIVRLREALGLPRHPAQVIASKDGRLDLDRTLLFNVPDVPVFVLAGDQCGQRCRASFANRPWIRVIPIEPHGLASALGRLRTEFGIERISCIGGRTTATSLIDAGLVQDVCLTTTTVSAGERDTPYYAGKTPPRLEMIVRKRERDSAQPIVFEHLAVRRGGL